MSGELANYANFFAGGSFADRPQEHRSIGSVPLSLVKIDYPAHDIPDPATENFILCLSLAGTVNAAFRFGERWVKETLRPGMFAPITPPRTLGELRACLKGEEPWPDWDPPVAPPDDLLGPPDRDPPRGGGALVVEEDLHHVHVPVPPAEPAVRSVGRGLTAT